MKSIGCSILLFIMTLFPIKTWAHHLYHARHPHHVFPSHLIKRKKHMGRILRMNNSLKQRKCLVKALLNESVGVKSHLARIEVARVLINRVLTKKFPDTLCGVYYQRHYLKHKKKCEFSDVCFHYKKKPFTAHDYWVADNIAKAAMRYTLAMGPGRFLYFSSDGKCPVAYQTKMRLSPFVFCTPSHLI